MSLKHVILGYLSWQPQSGYDLKQIIADSETLSWSANNNQIYKALVSLHNNQFVEKTIIHQDGTPSRHVYSILPAGLEELKDWMLKTPNPPHSNREILLQLMWSDALSPAEIDDLIDRYINEVGEKLFMLRVSADEQPNVPNRTKREAYLWQMIYKNWISHFELELRWARSLKQDLQEIG
ncbi:MAG: PadR family transcriptional regulator [Chloroflexota bacterium]